ncbi:MAG: peptide chain release factor N(5)-glutamine methyltransferase, partial [candidate division NC10 bacterium]|nr:peptide chain release factor N(5)-glutamine methyltransferase [candidate division NC10 bacterium]
MLIGQALCWAEEVLQRSGSTTLKLDAEILLAEILRCQRPFLYSHPEHPLSGEEEEIFQIWIARRSRGLPVAYLLCQKEFWSLDFLVTPAVLIPRPETEHLVEASLERKRKGNEEMAIAEAGCGSGAIVITLAKELGRGRFYATDASSAALWVARRNAIRHQVEGKISFLRGDLLEPLRSRHLEGGLDQVLSNPPYVPHSEIPCLPREIRLYEPMQALDGGSDGLFVIRRLISQARRFLRSGGWLLLEMGEGQGEAIGNLLSAGRD